MIREVVSIGPRESIENAVRLMTEHGISSLVVTSDGVLHGIVTERDVLTRVVARGLKPAETRVLHVMSPTLITVPPRPQWRRRTGSWWRRRSRSSPSSSPQPTTS